MCNLTLSLYLHEKSNRFPHREYIYIYIYVTYRTYPTIASVLIYMLYSRTSVIAYLFFTLTYIALQEYSYLVTPIFFPFSIYNQHTNYRFNNTTRHNSHALKLLCNLTNHSADVKRNACVFLINSLLSCLHYQNLSFSPNVVYVSTVTHTLYIAYMVQRK